MLKLPSLSSNHIVREILVSIMGTIFCISSFLFITVLCSLEKKCNDPRYIIFLCVLSITLGVLLSKLKLSVIWLSRIAGQLLMFVTCFCVCFLISFFYVINAIICHDSSWKDTIFVTLPVASFVLYFVAMFIQLYSFLERLIKNKRNIR